MPSSKAKSSGLGAAIRRLREERGMTQEGLAYEAGSTVATISSIERGRTNPNWGTVEAISKALGVSMAKLAKAAEDAAE